MAKQRPSLRQQIRQTDLPDPVVTAGEFELDISQGVLCGPTGQVKLTPKQIELLALLMRHSGQPVSRRQIMLEVWGTTYLGDTRTLEVHVCLLRKAIEPSPKFPRFLNTVRGIGYVFSP